MSDSVSISASTSATATDTSASKDQQLSSTTTGDSKANTNMNINDPNKSNQSGIVNYLFGLANRLLDALENCMDRMGFIGGRVFWCSWLLCVIVFLYFGHGSYKSKQQYYLMQQQASEVQTALLSVVKHQQFLNSQLLRLLSPSSEFVSDPSLSLAGDREGGIGESSMNSQIVIEEIILQIDALKGQLIALVSEKNALSCPK